MARHILQGERPIFFYGQAYMGSLDAYLTALGFQLFGQQVWVIRAVQGLLYLGTLATTYLLGRAAFDSERAGLLAAGILAIPAVNGMLYTTASLGGYGEALLIGNGILLVSVRLGRCSIPQKLRERWPLLLGWGILAGLGLWANGITLVYSLPAGLYLMALSSKMKVNTLDGIKMILSALMGFLLGALPWWLYALQFGFNRLLSELIGQAVAVEGGPWILRVGTHLVNYILLGLTALFGFRPPWMVQWLALPLLPFVLMLWMSVVVYAYRRLRAGSPSLPEAWLMLGVLAATTAGFLFTPFGVDPSGRYFLPLMTPFALAAASMILAVARRPWQIGALAALLVVFQGWGTVQCALQDPPGITTQFYQLSIIDHRADGELIRFLQEQGERRGYTSYWVAYPLAFQSAEDLIFVPRLPYHPDLRYTSRDDRYAPYDAQVSASERVAYITARNPGLDRCLVENLRRLGIAWEEKQIGDYRVYYHLSERVSPEAMGLDEAFK